MCNLPLVSDADSPPTDNRDFSPALSLTDCVTTYGGNVIHGFKNLQAAHVKRRCPAWHTVWDYEKPLTLWPVLSICLRIGQVSRPDTWRRPSEAHGRPAHARLPTREVRHSPFARG